MAQQPVIQSCLASNIPVHVAGRETTRSSRQLRSPSYEDPDHRFLTNIPPRHSHRVTRYLSSGLFNVRFLNHKVDDIL